MHGTEHTRIIVRTRAGQNLIVNAAAKILRQTSPLRLRMTTVWANRFPYGCNRRRRGRGGGIFREAGIANGKLAKKEDGAVERFDTAGMKTIVTEAGTPGVMQVLLRIRHAIKDSAVNGRADC